MATAALLLEWDGKGCLIKEIIYHAKKAVQHNNCSGGKHETYNNKEHVDYFCTQPGHLLVTILPFMISIMQENSIKRWNGTSSMKTQIYTTYAFFICQF